MGEGLERAIQGVPAPKKEPNYDNMCLIGGAFLGLVMTGAILYVIVKKAKGYSSIRDTSLYPPVNSHKEKDRFYQ